MKGFAILNGKKINLEDLTDADAKQLFIDMLTQSVNKRISEKLIKVKECDK